MKRLCLILVCLLACSGCAVSRQWDTAPVEATSSEYEPPSGESTSPLRDILFLPS